LKPTSGASSVSGLTGAVLKFTGEVIARFTEPAQMDFRKVPSFLFCKFKLPKNRDKREAENAAASVQQSRPVQQRRMR
jgi:hypothetical protein